jgi:hypothetical protein
VLTKRSLIRIVRTQEGIKIDPTGKLTGRGAYLHAEKTCWDKGIKGALASALRIELSTNDLERLKEYAVGLSNSPNNLGENPSPDREEVQNQK